MNEHCKVCPIERRAAFGGAELPKPRLGCIEGHMPEFVQLDYAETVLMPQGTYDDMKDERSAYSNSKLQRICL